MDVSQSLTIIATVSSILLSIIAIIKAFRTAPIEIKSEKLGLEEKEADIATKYEAMLNKSVDRVNDLEKRIDRLKDEIEKLRIEVEKRDKILNEWAIGIEKLINQIKVLNHNPIWQPSTEEN